MAYTPPSAGAIVVELSSGSLYTPPAASAIDIDLATSDGVTGLVAFINVSGYMTITGYNPAKTTVKHTAPAGSVTLVGYAPSDHITKTSTVGVSASMVVAGYAPTALSSKVSQITTYGQLVTTAHQPTYFKGLTQSIVQVAGLSLAGNAGISHTRSSSASIPLGALTLAAQPITQNLIHRLGLTGGMALAGHAGIVQRQRIRKEIVSRYFTPDVTLDNEGVLTLAGYPPAAQVQRIRRGVVGCYGLMYSVSASITGLYTGRVATAIGSTYDVQSAISASVASEYSVRSVDRVVQSVEGRYRMPVCLGIAALYSMVQNVPVRREIVAGYSLVQPVAVRKAIAADYALIQNVSVRNAVSSAYSAISNTVVRSSVQCQYSYNAIVKKAVSSRYSMTTPVTLGVSSHYSLVSVLRARASVMGIYSAPNSQVIAITDEPYVEYFGERIGLSEAELSIYEGDYAWKSSIVLTHVTDYAKLKQDQPFSVVIGSERYEFIVDSKELDRSNPANHAMKLLGISPSAKLTSPRHVSSSYLWDEYVQASDVAKELIHGIDWQVVDWGIPAYRLAVQDSTPVEVVKILAEAVGATLETNIDGSLYVRSLFPVSVPNYATTTPAHIFLEDTDILKVNESYVSSEVFNRLVITDISQDISDSLEWIPDYAEATTGVMRAYLYPWRSAVTLIHTGLPGVSIDSPNLGMTEHEEIIEVFQGQGQTSYPIHHVDSVQYEAQNVGALLFDVDSRSFTVGGPSFNSVIRLVYWTRSLDYRVALPTTRPTQFLLESEPL